MCFCCGVCGLKICTNPEGLKWPDIGWTLGPNSYDFSDEELKVAGLERKDVIGMARNLAIQWELLCCVCVFGATTKMA